MSEFTPEPLTGEWLEADGFGGFASGTVAGPRTRRYHALLLSATRPPTGRMALVNGFEAWVETPGGRFAITSHHYDPGVEHPDGRTRIESFRPDPWPRWTFQLEDGTRILQEIFVPSGVAGAVCVTWKTIGKRAPVRLRVRPLLSGRDYHSLHHENAGFRFDAEAGRARVVWRPYEGIPAIVSLANGVYEHAPEWYRRFLYEEERARGLDYLEDLASPGILSWDLAEAEAVWILEAAGEGDDADVSVERVVSRARAWREQETRRRALFDTPLRRAASSYLARRDDGVTIIAGYPWFTDWGRDTFIALRGLCLATGDLETARRILLAWSGWVSEGMLPNRFPDGAEPPEYNTVDASLWYVIAVHEYLQAAGESAASTDRRRMLDSVEAILAGYASGTRYGIRLDDDGLLAAGVPGVQLTWMDAKVGDWVVTPRIGKPVEMQALWLNALLVSGAASGRWREMLHRGLASFEGRFWNEAEGCLYDVVDVDHRPGTVDPTFRSNQILAVGGLPRPLIEGARAERVVAAVEAKLLTPLGLRSLAPGAPGYSPRYEGGVRERDGAYHQGTVWPWLIGPFVEAWVRVRGDTAAAGASGGRGERPHPGDQRRGAAPSAPWLSLPGLVGRRGAATRSGRARREAHTRRPPRPPSRRPEGNPQNRPGPRALTLPTSARRRGLHRRSYTQARRVGE